MSRLESSLLFVFGLVFLTYVLARVTGIVTQGLPAAAHFVLGLVLLAWAFVHLRPS